MAQAAQDKMTENVNVIWHYLMRAFPDTHIEVVLEPEPARREDRGFRIVDRQHAHFLNVPAEFLVDHDAAATTDSLYHWDVAQLLRDAEAKYVTVIRDEPPISAE